MSEWGNPARVKPGRLGLESIEAEKSTRGTETSKYPVERKSIETPLVAASERGPA